MNNELRIKNNTKYQAGFSTLEMLLAMVIIIFALTAVILVSFGNQSLLADSQTSGEALAKAQDLIEQQQALARKDFNLVNPSVSLDDIYTKTVTVNQTDYFTKDVTATVSWKGDHNRNESTSLSALVTNFTNALGGDTCSSVLTPSAEAWKTPHIKNSTTVFSTLAGVSGNFPITDVDAYQGKLYVTAGNTPNPADPTLFIFNISDSSHQTNPTLYSPTSKIDNSSTITAGLNAVAVADYVDTSGNKKTYAYVASGYGASFSTCTQASNCAQLQIFDVTNPSSLSLVYSYKLPSGSAPNVTGSSGQAVGNSVFYSSGYLYLGLTKTGGGPEFNIIDVHNPLSPNVVTGGYYSVGSAVNSIFVRGQYAYLATASNPEFIVLNISNPGSPQPVSNYDAAGTGSGKSIYGVGDNLYAGKTLSSGPELYLLNNSDPTKVLANNPTPQTVEANGSIDALTVRAGLDAASVPASHALAFLLAKATTNINFQIWDTADLTPWTPSKNISEFLSLSGDGGSTYEPVMDCEGNNFYIGSNTSANQSSLYVVAP